MPRATGAALTPAIRALAKATRATPEPGLRAVKDEAEPLRAIKAEAEPLRAGKRVIYIGRISLRPLSR